MLASKRIHVLRGSYASYHLHLVNTLEGSQHPITPPKSRSHVNFQEIYSYPIDNIGIRPNIVADGGRLLLMFARPSQIKRFPCGRPRIYKVKNVISKYVRARSKSVSHPSRIIH